MVVQQQRWWLLQKEMRHWQVWKNLPTTGSRCLRLQPKEVAIEVIPLLLSLQTKIVSTILVFINFYCSFLILHTLSALKVLLNYEVERLYLEVDNTSLPNLYNDMQNWSTCNASCSDSTYIVNYLVHYLETWSSFNSHLSITKGLLVIWILLTLFFCDARF